MACRPVPLYSVSEKQKRETEVAQDIFQAHMTSLVRSAQEFQEFSSKDPIGQGGGGDDDLFDRNSLSSYGEAIASLNELEDSDNLTMSTPQAAVGHANSYSSKRQLSLNNRTLSFSLSQSLLSRSRSHSSGPRDWDDAEEDEHSLSATEYSPLVSQVASILCRPVTRNHCKCLF